MKIFVEGPPGSGKNVVAAHIADKLKIRHINYRAVSIEACSKTNKISSRIKDLIKKEKCFPPKLAAHILQEYLKTNGINDFVVDGFPKSEEEVKRTANKLEFVYSEAVFGTVGKLYESYYGIPEADINNRIPRIVFDGENVFEKYLEH
jgi:adenylate kinase family enzyme